MKFLTKLTKKICLLGVLFGTWASVVNAQEVAYPNYDQMKDSMNVWMARFYKEHPCKDVNALRRGVLDDLNLENKVTIKKALPKIRKKALDGKELYGLCKASSLVFCTMDTISRPGAKSVEYRAYPMASAVALSEDGLCATNFHVLANVIFSGALKCEWNLDFMRFVMDENGKVYPVEAVLAADPVNDFALFKVNTAQGKLTPAPLGNSLQEGEEVYCLSHPQGNLYYFTRGMVSCNASYVDIYKGQVRYEMQITADYGVGSSGGPIFDNKGNLVGLVSSTFSLYANPQAFKNFQMSIKKTVPVWLLKQCITLKK